MLKEQSQESSHFVFKGSVSRELRGVKSGIIREVCSETSLTGESRFHISPPREFEPVTLVAGSKQVSPLDQ
jgi:hypothetical protein